MKAYEPIEVRPLSKVAPLPNSASDYTTLVPLALSDYTPSHSTLYDKLSELEEFDYLVRSS